MPNWPVLEVYQDLRSSDELRCADEKGDSELTLLHFDQAAGKWDSMDMAYCTSGHRIDGHFRDGCESLAR